MASLKYLLSKLKSVRLHSSSLIALKILELSAVIVALAAFIFDLSQRETDRAVRQAMLRAQIAQTIALPNGVGKSAVAASVRILVEEKVSLQEIALPGVKLINIDMSKMNLSFANLSNAVLENVNFSGATLNNVDFTGAFFKDVDLSKAKLSEVEFSKAKFYNVEISEADFSTEDKGWTTDLIEDQLQYVCADKKGVQLPSGLNLSKDFILSPCPANISGIFDNDQP